MAALIALLPITDQAAAQSEDGPVLEWYGFMKLDASWDGALVSAGNFARWVVSPESTEDHAHFNMTGRQSRVGVRILSKRGSADVLGRFEADFYGGGAENKNWLQLRHAYVQVSWPSGWEVIAGQASDLISPLVPTTLNYTVAWWAGNIGYRRPQFRLTKRFRPAEGTEVLISGAAARTIGDDFKASDPGDTGADSGIPTVQGRVAVTLPVGSGSLTLGGSAHHGRESLHEELDGADEELNTWSWGGDLRLALSARVAVSGEAWSGLNLDDHLGGIGQGLRITEEAATGVRSRGGWGQISIQLPQGVSLNGGGSVDDPDDTDLGFAFRARNRAVWGNVIKDFGDGLRAGLEFSRWNTEYVDASTGVSERIQLSVIYSF